MKRKGKIVTLVLSTSLLSSLIFPYASAMTSTAEAVKPEYTDGTELFEKEFMLGAWAEPELSDVRFQRFKDIGFNTMYLLNETKYNTTRLLAYLDKCEDYGLNAIISIGMNRTDPISIKTQKTSLANYPAFYGVHTVDEPLGDGSERKENEVKASEKTNGESYNTIYDYMYAEYEYMRDTYPGRYTGAVIAIGRNNGDFGYAALPAYTTKVLSKMNVEDRTLEYDVYPLKIDKNNKPYLQTTWLWRSYQNAEVAKDYSVPKRTLYYQQEWNYRLREWIGVPELLNQLYTGMCFGVNGLVAFKYDTYWKDFLKPDDFFMVSAWGESELCYYNEKAFEEIKKFDHIYLDFADNWQGVMKVRGTSANDNEEYRAAEADLQGKYVLQSYAGLKAVQATEDALVGVMKDKEGRDGYMITNQAFTLDKLSNTVKVSFNGGYTKAIVILNGEETVVDLKDGGCEFTLLPGGGAFVIPY